MKQNLQDPEAELADLKSKENFITGQETAPVAPTSNSVQCSLQ